MADDTSEKRYQKLATFGSSALGAVPEAAMIRFKRMGVVLTPDNRLERAREILKQSQAGGSLVVKADDLATAKLVAEAARDSMDMYFIARTLPRARPNDYEGKLRVMLRGDNRPDDRFSQPRDYQFELLGGAFFAMAEIDAWPAEPDVRFKFEDQDWGAPIKRVRSEEQLAKRTTKARKQLEKQGLKGPIIINVDSFVGDLPVVAPHDEVTGRFEGAIRRLTGLYPELQKQEALSGVMAMGQIAEWDFTGEKPRLSRRWVQHGRAFAAEGTTAYRSFEHLMRRLDERMQDRVNGLAADVQAILDGDVSA